MEMAKMQNKLYAILSQSPREMGSRWTLVGEKQSSQLRPDRNICGQLLKVSRVLDQAAILTPSNRMIITLNKAY
jgi:hypothetical protein